MSNELIQKNAELGKFLFCERYTLQPVKNALYIAEGQDLKRGAVVDVNGVLVGTNSLMPYAVLETDCDTRAKGAFASVFVKGEFNFDKLFFDDGLSKEDIDNIVYNGNGTGLVFKPYNYSSYFAPKTDDFKEISYIKQLLTNPLNLPSKTIRCKFTSYYTPAMGTSQTLVDSDNNVWDIRFNDAVRLFQNNANLLQVIGANTSGVKDMGNMFNTCTSLTNVALFDTSSVTNVAAMFSACSSLTSLPLFDTSSVITMQYMCNWCSSLTSLPLFDTSSATNMNSTFFQCTSVKYGSLAIYQQASANNPQPSHTDTFTGCGSNTDTGASELAQIPASWGGTAS